MTNLTDGENFDFTFFKGGGCLLFVGSVLLVIVTLFSKAAPPGVATRNSDRSEQKT